MDIITHVAHSIKDNNLIKPHTTVVVGLSGGPDSVFLLHVLTYLAPMLGITIIAAHLDHEWRLDSAQDVLFCKTLCQKLGVLLVSKKASELTRSAKYNGSKEALGRYMRRHFLETTATAYNAEAIALAHHQDDQQETFFIRLFRGTSLTGLAGMRSKHGLYIRPLLSIHKSAILAYLHKHGITYLYDSTNADNRFLRNRIRNALIPALKACDSRFDQSFKKTLIHIVQTEQFIEEITETTFKAIAQEIDGVIWLDKEKFFACNHFLHIRLLLRWLYCAHVPFTPTTAFLNEIYRFLEQSNSQSHAVSTTWYIVKKQNLVAILKNQELALSS
jgi:tRNA(Ile)-lysidine synthase